MLTQGTLAFAGHAGTNRLDFQGRLSGSKQLGPGEYTLIILATNTGGQRSEPQALRFTIVR
jgi:hypothetical protein